MSQTTTLNVDSVFNGLKIQIDDVDSILIFDLVKKDMCIFERSDEARVGLPGNVDSSRKRNQTIS